MRKKMTALCLAGTMAFMMLQAASVQLCAEPENVLEAAPLPSGESITIEEEPVVEFEGSTAEGVTNEYSYTAPRSGRYGFEVENLTANTWLVTKVYDNLGNECGTILNTEKGKDKTMIELEEGFSYVIKVPKHQDDSSNFIVRIKPQKPETDITHVNEIHDQIMFIYQKNVYTYTAPYTGYYLCDLKKDSANTNFQLMMWDSNGTNIMAEALAASEGIYLDAGETYQVQVRYENSYGGYTLHIYPQKETLEISGYTEITDSMEFHGQRNNYLFEAPVEGQYTFAAESEKSNNELQLNILNESGDDIGDMVFMPEDNRFAELEAGETVTIRVTQREGKGGYTLKIGYPQGAEPSSTGAEGSDSESSGDDESLVEENQRLKEELETLQEKYDLMVQILQDSGFEIPE